MKFVVRNLWAENEYAKTTITTLSTATNFKNLINLYTSHHKPVWHAKIKNEIISST